MEKKRSIRVTIFRIIVISTVLFLNQYAYATIQESDSLLYKDKKYEVYGFELTDEMSKNRMTFLKETGNVDNCWASTSNWDGISISLSVKDNKLYITKIDLDNWELLGKPSCQVVFGISIPEEGLFANWFSGELRPTFYSWHADESSFTFYFKKGVLEEIRKGPTQE